MAKNITIKDIAQKAGVSTGTVHRAIYGKKGVTAEVRERILALCDKEGYRANTAASALKRGQVHIVVAFPGPMDTSRYFYLSVWKGFRRCIAELSDFNLDIIEAPYYIDSRNNQATVLAEILQRRAGNIDGLLTIGHFDASCKEVVQSYAKQGIPVYLACDDTNDCGRIACVQVNYDMTGRMTAELLTSQIPENSTILLLAGDVLIPSHYRTILGFENYINENHADIKLCKINGYSNIEELKSRLTSALVNDKSIAAAVSVSARLSVLLAGQIAALGLAEQIRVVASDVFDENIANMQAGIVKNIIYKNQEEQAYLAAKLLTDHLLKAKRPLTEVQYVATQLIFRSNLEMFV